jgi:hypothetical protein
MLVWQTYALLCSSLTTDWILFIHTYDRKYNSPAIARTFCHLNVAARAGRVPLKKRF